MAHRVRHVHDHELAYVQAHGPFDLLIVQDLPNDTSVRGAELNWDRTECVQPANIRRMTQKCLHQLPGAVRLRMVQSSLESLFKQVDSIACTLAIPKDGLVLPEGLEDQKRREDILTLNLLCIIDRLQRPAFVVAPLVDRQNKKARKTSIWEQGGVPRTGGRS